MKPLFGTKNPPTKPPRFSLNRGYVEGFLIIFFDGMYETTPDTESVAPDITPTDQTPTLFPKQWLR